MSDLKVAIVGVGLIGGSVARAARERLDATVTGWDPDPVALATAVAGGVLDAPAVDVADAVAGADVVFVAAPLGAVEAAVAQTLAVAGPDCVVTDVGSTKQAVAQRFAADERFVGGHPLAGAETAGVAHARADLFQGATWFLTPGPTTAGTLYERLHRLLTGIGARPVAVDAALHDEVMAGVSHLPHVLANVLVSHVWGAVGDREQLPATGPSFRDATRVAGANPALWADIYLANAPALVVAIDDAVARLTAARNLIAGGDRAGLEAWQGAVAAEHAQLAAAGESGGPTQELRVSVTNRPGVMAEIALALGRAGIGISDLTLAPSSDNTVGVIALWVGEADAARATELVDGLGFAVVAA